MSIKTKSGVALVLTSLAAIEAARIQAAALNDQINAAELNLKAETETKVKAEVEGLLPRIGKILGKDINLGELLPIVSAVVKGNPLFASKGSSGDKTQLNDVERAALRADMHARAAALKAGTPAMPISQIASKHNVNPNTAANYKPSKAEVDAMPGTAEVPESAYAKVA